MTKHRLVILLLLFTPSSAISQRYGRPYTLAENPQILLQIRVANNSRYFRVSELRKMKRSVLTQIDPVTKTVHVYEGVALQLLVPIGDVVSKSGSIRIDFGSHQTLTVSGLDLDSAATLVVIDTVDGKPLSGHVPFYFLAKSSDKPITDVECITVKLPR